MKKNKHGSKGGATAQPLDPSQNARDLFGDPTGLTGITSDDKKDTGRRLSPELYNDEEYDKSALRGMSQTKAAIAEDVASEDETATTEVTTPSQVDSDAEPYLVNKKDASGNDSPGSDNNNTAGAAYSQDDTLEVAHASGMQLDEDDEHPQELNIARDIDQAEESIRSH
jgi:hypothetical protein